NPGSFERLERNHLPALRLDETFEKILHLRLERRRNFSGRSTLKWGWRRLRRLLRRRSASALNFAARSSPLAKHPTVFRRKPARRKSFANPEPPSPVDSESIPPKSPHPSPPPEP